MLVFLLILVFYIRETGVTGGHTYFGTLHVKLFVRARIRTRVRTYVRTYVPHGTHTRTVHVYVIVHMSTLPVVIFHCLDNVSTQVRTHVSL